MNVSVNGQRLSSDFGHLVNSRTLVRRINENPKSPFKAKLYERFDSIAKLINLSRRNGGRKFSMKTVQSRKFKLSKGLAIPPEYDLRKNWYQCVGDIQNEGQCGAVWAMAPSATVSDRMCIQSNAKFQERLSSQYILECDTRDFGCNGGYMNTEFEFELNRGVPTEKCVPYIAFNMTLQPCPTSCFNSTQPMVLYKTKSVQNVTGELDMQQAILQGGSIMTEMDVYQDFIYYSSGVYEHDPSFTQPIAKTVARIVGWGSLNGVNYWIVANVWGKTWGLDGYVLVRRGTNESNIEKDAYAFQVY
ncbi:predicted protein [Naegleria gruberi]|uniref:Predicted protein n=1 Tax=Naegleria gruberi TaxID=5762 RepID=D2VSR7_NAEGR|nr:uncharacterized protein NAEGRDRAFT_72036 [Naegleria gruberi]EFC40166.1 predicted protein [Naegleria gruberi]|eukprot:XP_002672910.1 predicted protein [Naegleria gruberi strain NEG-M]